MRKIFLWILSGVMVFSLVGCQSKPQDTNNQELSSHVYGLRDDIEDGTILHCFSWSFNTIYDALEDIALAGYSAIQTSPINACYDGGNAGMELYGQGRWYYHYQPIDWTIGNYQLGSRDEFKKMCDKAEQLGIKVIVDVAPNHTTKETEAISEAFLNAVGGIENLYHSQGMLEIKDYTNREECTLQGVAGLYDVNTENKDFQDYFIAFLNDCIACGADGFRYDTAKHIGLEDDPKDAGVTENNFWPRVTTEINQASEIFMYGEVLQDDSERLADYIDVIGATTASYYGARVRGGFTTTTLKAESFGDLMIGDASPNVVTWVESHDNYTGDGTYASLTNDDLRIAYAFIAAKSEGTPLFFSRPYEADATHKWGTFNRIGMIGDNLYKDSVVVAANHFRNAMVGLPEHIINADNTSHIIGVERGTKGLVIVNANKKAMEFIMETNLEDGTYLNRADKQTEFVVKKGKIEGTIEGKGAIILYNNGYIDVDEPSVLKVATGTKSQFVEHTHDVTLEMGNVLEATYQIDNGEMIQFSNGDTVTIGENINPGETTTLTLRAVNKAGKSVAISYVFKKQNVISSGTKIYFEKPEEWGNQIYAYVYDETSYSTVKENRMWPGVKMEQQSDGVYCYTMEDTWQAGLVIFTDGVNQSNGVLEPGEEIVADKFYTLEN